MNREISFKETVELFINTIIYDIVNEVEIPRINFIFNENAYDLFYEVMKKPFKLKKGWTPDIKEEDIFFLKNIIDYNYPSIFIKDHIKFFSLLTNITNNLIKSYNKHNQNKISRSLLMNIMRRIWLRMGVDDFNNVEMFLEKQLEFVKTDFFEEYNFNVNKTHTIDTFHNYKVKIFNSLNNTWDESNKCISFLITNNEENHELPNIYYDIINKTCYIYAVQNSRNAHKSLIINKMIYKEYRGSCQPNKNSLPQNNPHYKKTLHKYLLPDREVADRLGGRLVYQPKPSCESPRPERLHDPHQRVLQTLWSNLYLLNLWSNPANSDRIPLLH